MVDKVAKVAIIISATLLNKFGKEPGTGALSHTFANLTKYIFGVDLPTQLPAYLMASHPRIVTDALTGWVVFFVSKNRQAGSSADTPKPALTCTIGGPTVQAKNNIPQSRGIVKFPTLESILNFPTPNQPAPDSSQPESFNLALSADIDEARHNVELLKETIIENGQALLYWQGRLSTLENQIPEIQNHLIGQLKTVLAELK